MTEREQLIEDLKAILAAWQRPDMTVSLNQVSTTAFNGADWVTTNVRSAS